jgi:hypothetical protein
MTGTSSFEGRVDRGQLGLTSDEARQSTRRHCMQARSRQAGPNQFERVDWSIQPLNRHRPERTDLHITFNQP